MASRAVALFALLMVACLAQSGCAEEVQVSSDGHGEIVSQEEAERLSFPQLAQRFGGRKLAAACSKYVYFLWGRPAKTCTQPGAQRECFSATNLTFRPLYICKNGVVKFQYRSLTHQVNLVKVATTAKPVCKGGRTIGKFACGDSCGTPYSFYYRFTQKGAYYAYDPALDPSRQQYCKADNLFVKIYVV